MLLNSGNDFAACFTQRRERALIHRLLNGCGVSRLGFGCFLCSLNNGSVRALKLRKVVGNLLANVRNSLRSKVKLLASLHVVRLQFSQLSIEPLVNFLQVGFSSL